MGISVQFDSTMSKQFFKACHEQALLQAEIFC
jgi:hypothetical protein